MLGMQLAGNDKIHFMNSTYSVPGIVLSILHAPLYLIFTVTSVTPPVLERPPGQAPQGKWQSTGLALAPLREDGPCAGGLYLNLTSLSSTIVISDDSRHLFLLLIYFILLVILS